MAKPDFKAAGVHFKGRMFNVTVAIDKQRLRALKETPEVLQKAIQAGAEYWHTKILPDHFKKDAQGKYDYAMRAMTYLRAKQKAGKPDLIYSGSLRRDLKANLKFTVNKASVTMVMTARVLNLIPRTSQNDQNKYIKHRNRGYPNLKREIKRITSEEREAIAAVVTKALEAAYSPSSGNKGEITNGSSE